MSIVTPVAALIASLQGPINSADDESYHLWTLKTLNAACPLEWCEIASKIAELEAYYMRLQSGNQHLRKSAALLASQINFHLDNYPRTLTYAVESDYWFLEYLTTFYKPVNAKPQAIENVAPPSAKEFVDKVVSLLFDEYVAMKTSAAERALVGVITTTFGGTNERYESAGVPLEQVQKLIEYLLDLENSVTYSEDVLKLLLGIALESCNETYVERILRTGDFSRCFALIRHILGANDLLMASKNFRQTILRLIASIYGDHLSALLTVEPNVALPNSVLFDELPTYVQTLFMIGDADSIAKILKTLVINLDQLNSLRAYQLAFDLFNYGSQAVIKSIREHELLRPEPQAPVDDTKTTDSAVSQVSQVLSKLESILNGSYQARLFLRFSNAKNQTDLAILDTVKRGLGSRYAILHTVLITAHSFLQRGTTCDIFLRNNLDWFSKTLSWGKFTATASLGVVHQTHNDKSFRVLSTYLPGIPGWTAGSSYSDGGALYALGLIHANVASEEVVHYLLTQLSVGSGRQSQEDQDRSVNEVTQYGASLALGLAAMGSRDSRVSEALEGVLMMDSANAGEAAAIGLGLLMCGSGDKRVIETLLVYAEETRHEKIIRACGLAVAFVCAEIQEDAVPFIEQMLNSSDPLVRYGGCFTLGLAYVGTSKQAALRTLLHIAVSDPVDDVRQGAVLSISYLLHSNPEHAPKVFRFLADSFNYRVRYAAALAIGISCAGTGNPEALAILVPATRDAHDIVRQGAFIALGLVMCECSERWVSDMKQRQEKYAPETQKKANEQNRNLKKKQSTPVLDGVPSPMEIREHLMAVSMDNKEDLMARVGAIVGLGIIDAGGRNCTIAPVGGGVRRETLVGLVLFSQYWYWYPLMLCLSLAMSPTPIIGVTGDFRVPASYAVESANPPSLFAYSPKYEPEKKEKKVKIADTILNAALRSSAGLERKEEQEKVEREEHERQEKLKAEKERALKDEPQTQVIQNGCRIVPQQIPMLKSLSCGHRFTPVFPKRKPQIGIVVLQDNQTSEGEEEYLME